MAVRQAALVSDESALDACACSRRCAIQIDDLYLFTFLIPSPSHKNKDLGLTKIHCQTRVHTTSLISAAIIMPQCSRHNTVSKCIAAASMRLLLSLK